MQRLRGWMSTDLFSCKRGVEPGARELRERDPFAGLSAVTESASSPPLRSASVDACQHLICVRGRTRDVDGRRRWVHAQASDELTDLVRKQWVELWSTWATNL